MLEMVQSIAVLLNTKKLLLPAMDVEVKIKSSILQTEHRMCAIRIRKLHDHLPKVDSLKNWREEKQNHKKLNGLKSDRVGSQRCLEEKWKKRVKDKNDEEK